MLEKSKQEQANADVKKQLVQESQIDASSIQDLIKDGVKEKTKELENEIKKMKTSLRKNSLGGQPSRASNPTKNGSRQREQYNKYNKSSKQQPTKKPKQTPNSPPPKEKTTRWASPIISRGKPPSKGKKNPQRKKQENRGGANKEWRKEKGKQKSNGRRS